MDQSALEPEVTEGQVEESSGPPSRGHLLPVAPPMNESNSHCSRVADSIQFNLHKISCIVLKLPTWGSSAISPPRRKGVQVEPPCRARRGPLRGVAPPILESESLSSTKSIPYTLRFPKFSVISKYWPFRRQRDSDVQAETGEADDAS